MWTTCYRLALVGVLALLGATGASAARHVNSQDEAAQRRAVDTLFEKYNAPGSPGAAVGIYRRGEIVHMRGYGHANLESGAPIAPRTVFNIASVSKHFTAFAIALLVREGKVDLDADIRTYLPYVPDFGKPITVRHLLHHTSGLRSQETLFELAGHDMRGYVRQQQVINLVARQRELNFTPGTQYSYSNTGYSLLAQIVAAVSGRSFREFTTERMFRPLGMSQSFFGDDIGEIIPGRAQSYIRSADGTRWQRMPQSYEIYGATYLLTSMEDLMKWAANFARPRVGDAEIIRRMVEPGRLDDGTAVDYGWALIPGRIAGHEAVWHTGGSAAFNTILGYFPKQDLVIVVLHNTRTDVSATLRAIATVYLGDIEQHPVERAPPVKPPTDRDLRVLPGFYLAEGGQLIQIERDGNELQLRSGQASARKITMRRDDTFDLGTRDKEFYRLKRGVRGEVFGLRRIDPRRPDGAVELRRTESVQPTSADLAALAGDYYSPELDITYSFEARERQLVARSLWLSAPLSFLPTITDRFDSADAILKAIVVERDDRGCPRALRVHSRSMIKVRFERVRAGAEPSMPSRCAEPCGNHRTAYDERQACDRISNRSDRRSRGDRHAVGASAGS